MQVTVPAKVFHRLQFLLNFLFTSVKTQLFIIRWAFTNYVYKRREVGGQKNRLFVNFYTIENVNGGVRWSKRQIL